MSLVLAGDGDDDADAALQKAIWLSLQEQASEPADPNEISLGRALEDFRVRRELDLALLASQMENDEATFADINSMYNLTPSVQSCLRSTGISLASSYSMSSDQWESWEGEEQNLAKDLHENACGAKQHAANQGNDGFDDKRGFVVHVPNENIASSREIGKTAIVLDDEQSEESSYSLLADAESNCSYPSLQHVSEKSQSPSTSAVSSLVLVEGNERVSDCSSQDSSFAVISLAQEELNKTEEKPPCNVQASEHRVNLRTDADIPKEPDTRGGG